MTDTFRALCVELVELSAPTDSIPRLAERLQKLAELANRARAALAQPEPVAPPMPVPGDAEGLAEVFWNRYDQPEPVAPTDEEIIAFWSEHCAGDGDAGILRLARWGTPANTTSEENLDG